MMTGAPDACQRERLSDPIEPLRGCHATDQDDFPLLRRRVEPAAAVGTADLRFAHQSGHSLARDLVAVLAQIELRGAPQLQREAAWNTRIRSVISWSSTARRDGGRVAQA
jgi:hypothetical protein